MLQLHSKEVPCNIMLHRKGIRIKGTVKTKGVDSQHPYQSVTNVSIEEDTNDTFTIGTCSVLILFYSIVMNKRY